MLVPMKQNTSEVFDEQQKVIINEFVEGKLFFMRRSDVRKLIWELTYDAENAVKHIGFYPNELNGKQAHMLREELIWQYQDKDPYIYSDIMSLKGESQALKELRNKADSDRVSIHEITRGISNLVCFNTYPVITAAIYMLRSKDKTIKKNGLCKMGFSRKEREFLCEYTDIISRLIESMMKR